MFIFQKIIEVRNSNLPLLNLYLLKIILIKFFFIEQEFDILKKNKSFIRGYVDALREYESFKENDLEDYAQPKNVNPKVL